MYKEYVKVKFGYVEVIANDEGITNVGFVDETGTVNKNEHTSNAVKQLSEYFNEERLKFELPLVIDGTPFQEKCWKALLDIPYGETRSYQDIAKAIGNEKAVRAVGGANNKNKIGIIIPCHRVIGKNNMLVGYAGGLHYKKYLLELEKSYKAE